MNITLHTKKTSALDDYANVTTVSTAASGVGLYIVRAAVLNHYHQTFTMEHIRKTTPYGGTARYRNEKVGDVSTSWD